MAKHTHLRGRVRLDGIIEFPEDWFNRINTESINVQLTSNAVHQELFVESIPYGRKVIVRNASGGAIDAFYSVTADLTDEA
tara:strand:- start:5983 stop:6225 length:243 start_codon:yes stop_codon:yes gene_type:complete